MEGQHQRDRVYRPLAAIPAAHSGQQKLIGGNHCRDVCRSRPNPSDARASCDLRLLRLVGDFAFLLMACRQSAEWRGQSPTDPISLSTNSIGSFVSKLENGVSDGCLVSARLQPLTNPCPCAQSVANWSGSLDD